MKKPSMRLWIGLSALFHFALGATLFEASFASPTGHRVPVSDRVMMVGLADGIAISPTIPPPVHVSSHARRPSPAPPAPVERKESEIPPSSLYEMGVRGNMETVTGQIVRTGDAEGSSINGDDGRTSQEAQKTEGDLTDAPSDAVPEAPPVLETGSEDTYRPLVLAALAREKRYPLLARQRGLEGVVEIAFTIDPDGRVSQPEVISSSRHPVLDQAALGMVLRLGSLPPPPEPAPLRFPARIQYRLDEQ